jgi:hypothetical protein
MSATLQMLHTQGLSRSPHTVPTNTEAADRTCLVSGLCIHKKARKAHVRGAGGSRPSSDHRVADPTSLLVTAPCICSAWGRLHAHSGRHWRRAPRNSIGAEFGVDAGAPLRVGSRGAFRLSSRPAERWHRWTFEPVRRRRRRGRAYTPTRWQRISRQRSHT